jgi:hypothetical protein
VVVPDISGIPSAAGNCDWCVKASCIKNIARALKLS